MISRNPRRVARQRERGRRWLTALSVCLSLGVLVTPAVEAQRTFESAIELQLAPLAGGDWRGEPIHHALQRLYSLARRQPLWTSEGRSTRQAREVVRFIAHVETRGLEPALYGVKALGDIVATLDSVAETDSSRLAVIDVTFSRALLALLSDLERGRVDPATLHADLHADHDDRDIAASALAISRGDDVPTAIAAVEPLYAGYAALIDALARYRALAADTTLTLPRAARTVRPGDLYPDAPRLRRLLLALGDLPAAAARTTDTTRHVGALVLAVMQFQRRHGLEADGVLGPETMGELRLPLADRVRQIELTLERWRWLPHQAPERCIVVNIPAFRLHAFEHDSLAAKPVLSMNVVVGDAERRHDTPIFIGEMREIVFRPYWDIPVRIARTELVPAIRRGEIDMASEGYEIVGMGDNPRIYPATRANLTAVVAGTLRLRQRPGPRNALGLVKFVFPNAHDVYLHGTPAMQLFRYARRDFSHGCIRAERAVELAEFALCRDSSWRRQSIEDTMRGSETVRVRLAKPVMVYVLYFTAAVAADGTVHFYPDLYDQDLALERALDAR